MGTLSAFAKLFIPSPEPDPDDKQAVKHHARALVAWRHWMGWSQLLLWGFFWWAIGLGSAMGIESLGSGFARAETANRIEKRQLEELIIAEHERYCLAKKGSEARSYYWQRLQEKQDEYENITGKRYVLLPCEDIIGSLEQ